MKVKIDTKKLLQAVLLVGAATTGRTTLPILSSIKIDAADGWLTISGTNLDMFITERVEAEKTTTGSAVVAFRLFSTFLQRIGTQTVTLTLKDAILKVEGGQNESNFETLPAEEFPPQLHVPDSGKTECEWSDFVKPLSLVSYAMSDDASRYVLMGVSMKQIKNDAQFAATNAKKLAICGSGVMNNFPDIVIPAACVQVLIKNITESGKIGVTVGAGVIAITAGNSEIRSKLVEGKYPSYESVVPKGGKFTFSCYTAHLKEAVSTTSLFLQEPAIGINIAGKGKELQVSCGAKSKHMILGTGLEGQPDFNITLNYRHLLETLNVIESEEVRIECTTEEDPALIREGKFSAIMVPVVLAK